MLGEANSAIAMLSTALRVYSNRFGPTPLHFSQETYSGVDFTVFTAIPVKHTMSGASELEPA
jgi:hypothetical protein